MSIGLDCGADDYMVKPFEVLELSVRIRNLLPGSQTGGGQGCAVLPGHPGQPQDQGRCQAGGRLVELTLKEFELLVYLLENQSRVVTRDELLNRIWGYEYDGEPEPLTCTYVPFARSWGKRAVPALRRSGAWATVW